MSVSVFLFTVCWSLQHCVKRCCRAKPLTEILLFSPLKSRETLSPDLWPHNRNYWKDWVQHVTSIQQWLCMLWVNTVGRPITICTEWGFILDSFIEQEIKQQHWTLKQKLPLVFLLYIKQLHTTSGYTVYSVCSKANVLISIHWNSLQLNIMFLPMQSSCRF